MKISEAVGEVMDRAHYVTPPAGPSEVRYISISEHALREALAAVLHSGEGVREALRETRTLLRAFVNPETDLIAAAVFALDPEAPEHCIPGPGCRHRHDR